MFRRLGPSRRYVTVFRLARSSVVCRACPFSLFLDICSSLVCRVFVPVACFSLVRSVFLSDCVFHVFVCVFCLLCVVSPSHFLCSFASLFFFCPLCPFACFPVSLLVCCACLLYPLPLMPFFFFLISLLFLLLQVFALFYLFFPPVKK